MLCLVDITALGLLLKGAKATKAPAPYVADFYRFADFYGFADLGSGSCDSDDVGTCAEGCTREVQGV